MINRIVTILTLVLLTISAPLLLAATPGQEHHHPEQKAPIDWSAYPADVQALKAQLDQIRIEQKGLFRQMRSQNDQIKRARESLTPEQRNSLKKPAKQLIQQMISSRDAIRSLRDKKHESWDKFQEHAASKQWDPAKNDLRSIIEQKKQIVEKQQGILKLQKQLLTIINPSSQSHVHSD
ncbi:hypothetical protein [Cohnella lupini]|uniref:Uncharacterized protein n=1 Tax=Cohnella lupini TaxID=1294267 RepID=A0A3D9I8Q4_9BACL|nr:hypothetical protein [Cohnella lupini]RED57546.1 hypothetical protein DFP95_11018 [Cohnella lupini]